MSCCSDLKVFMPFYSQTATCLYRRDVLLRGLCSFGHTFSDVSGPTDAETTIFVEREATGPLVAGWYGLLELLSGGN